MYIQQCDLVRFFLDVSKICDCKSKQFEWFLYNKNMAVPEYIIEYEYMHKVK